MSDLYDSLEDENDNEEFSDSLESDNSKLFIPTFKIRENKSAESHRSFFLNNCNDEENHSIIRYTNTQNVCPDKFFLPKIENVQKGRKKSCYNIIVDNEVLIKQGLQLNNDGSFTKSPRMEPEVLPFVTREYKTLQFQRKPAEKKKKANPIKINRKDIFSFKEKPENGISMIGLISARSKKGSSEEILTSGESLPSFEANGLKTEKRLPGNDNLTDSMKEILLQNHKSNKFVPKNFKTSKQIKKIDDALDLMEKRKIKKYSNGPVISQQQSSKCSTERTKNSTAKKNKKDSQMWSSSPCNFKPKVKAKPSQPDVIKYQSDVLLKTLKPQLSYSERRQKEIGFNPSSLRYDNKKIASDTVRSNYGDSVAEKLSEISSRILSNENLLDPEEEMFYQKLIQEDQSKNWGLCSRAKSFVQHKNNSESIMSDISNGSTKISQVTSNPKCKRVAKSTSIDLTTDAQNLEASLKKFNHSCSRNASSMSKTELALKAKAYGYMANARNIFKIKTQSKGKFDGESSVKVSDKRRSTLKKALSDQCGTKGLNSRTAEDKNNCRQCVPMTSRSSCKSEKCGTISKKQTSFVLPRVDSFQKSENKLKTEILKGISLCLNGLTGKG